MSRAVFKTDKDVTDDILKVFEGFKSSAYTDTAGYGTIGYGHKLTANDKGMLTASLSDAEGEALLKKDIAAHQNGAMRDLKVPLNTNQKAALTSLAFNTGANSTAVRNVVKLANAGKMDEAGEEFLKYSKAGGQHSNVLAQRRTLESKLFATQVGDEISLEDYGSKKWVVSLPEEDKETKSKVAVSPEPQALPPTVMQVYSPHGESSTNQSVGLARTLWTKLRTLIG